MTLDAGEIVNRDRYPIEDLYRALRRSAVDSMYRVRELYGKVSDVHAIADSARVRADQLLD